MFEFLKRNTDLEERIIALEKRVAALEKKNKKLAAAAGKSDDKEEKKADKKADKKLDKAARKEAAYQKKVDNSVKKVMERTGWDYESTKAKLLATAERTGCTPTEFFLYRFYELTGRSRILTTLQSTRSCSRRSTAWTRISLPCCTIRSAPTTTSPSTSEDPGASTPR